VFGDQPNPNRLESKVAAIEPHRKVRAIIALRTIAAPLYSDLARSGLSPHIIRCVEVREDGDTRG
jgi:hypothetical protein